MKYILLIITSFICVTSTSAQWTTLSAPVTSDLHDVDFLTPDYGVIVGDQGNIHLTTNGGLNWTGINTSVPGSILHVLLLNTDTFFVSTYNSVTVTATVYVTVNAGQNWTPVFSDNSSNHALDLATNDFVQLFCDGSNVTVTDDIGSTWDTVLTFTGSIISLFQLKFADSQTGIAAGNVSGFGGYSCFFHRSEDGGVNWYDGDLNSYLNSDALTAFCHVNADTVMLFNNDYNIFTPSNINNVVRLTNFIQTILSPGDTVFSFTSTMMNPSMPAYINDAAFINSSTGFAFGDNGTVYRTIDGGTTWTPDYITGIPLFATDFSGSTGYAVGNDGLVIKYTNNVGLHNAEGDSDFKLYPTIAKDELYVEYNGSNADFEISNSIGQVVLIGKLSNGKLTINISEFSSGSYNFKTTSQPGSSSLMFMVE